MREPFSFSSFFNECRQHMAGLAAYILFFLVFGLAIGALSFLGRAARPAGIISLLQPACFAGLGLVYLLLFKKRLFFWGSGDPFILSRGGWWFTVLLSSGMAGCLVILYTLTGYGSFWAACAGACIFAFPLTVYQSWLAFAAIPEKEYQIWYSSSAVPGALTLPRGRGVHVRISVARNYFDQQKISFIAAMPLRVRLGDLFYHFMIEQNDNHAAGISYLDENQQPFGWEFYTPRWGGIIKRRLYSECNMLENKIKDDNIIIAKRVKRTNTPRS